MKKTTTSIATPSTGGGRLRIGMTSLAISIAVAVAAGMPPGEAHAQGNAAITLSMPAQSLNQALLQLGQQTDVQIYYLPQTVAGLNAPALSGEFTLQQALDKLLAGTGLVARREGGTIVVKPAPTKADSELAPVTVVGQGESATGPLNGYVATRSVTATKTDTPLLETPQSISIIGAEQIETLKAQDLTDAFGYTAGVSRKGGSSRTTDEFFVRGFESSAFYGNVYRDGTKYTVNVYNGQQEPYGLERIELLKGASSVLYGASGPGGIINTVTKRPTTEPLHEINAELGSFNRKQISGDFGGALDKDGEWSYRLTFLNREADTFIKGIPDNRTYIASALKWQPNASTSLTLLADYQHDRTMDNNGLPASGTVLSNPNGVLPRDLYTGEPSYDKFDSTRYTMGYLFEHAFNDQLKLRNSLRYYHFSSDFPMVQTYGLAADQRTSASRYALDRVDESSSVVSDTSLQYQWAHGAFKHTSLAGVDYTMSDHQTERYRRTASSLNLFNPVYTGVIGSARTSQGRDDGEYRRLGFYAQEQMKIADKWVFLLGGRYDSVRYNFSNSIRPSAAIHDEKSSAFTGRAGFVYLADNGLAPFISYSESFEPQSGTDRLGSRFVPLTGNQYEVGVRYQPNGSDTMLSAALYQLTRQNVLVSDPSNTSYSIQVGEVRSRGLELEAKTKVGKDGNLIAAYAYTDARTTKASPLYPEQEGKRTGATPYNQFSLWFDYTFGRLGLPGLRAGAGMRYVGATRAVYVDATVPAFTVFDAMVSYTTGPWKLAMNVTNLTDKTYVASCISNCFYGEPRKIITTATYRW